MTGYRRAAVHLLRGLSMGAADVVPGVSGGTIALLLGIYDRLIGSIREGSRALGLLIRGDLRGSLARAGSVEWTFLLPLLAGVAVAVGTGPHVVDAAAKVGFAFRGHASSTYPELVGLHAAAYVALAVRRAAAGAATRILADSTSAIASVRGAHRDRRSPHWAAWYLAPLRPSPRLLAHSCRISRVPHGFRAMPRSGSNSRAVGKCIPPG